MKTLLATCLLLLVGSSGAQQQGAGHKKYPVAPAEDATVTGRFRMFSGSIIDSFGKPSPIVIRIDSMTGQMWQVFYLPAGARKNSQGNEVEIYLLASEPIPEHAEATAIIGGNKP